MGYLFLALALLAGVTKAYCGKKTSFAVVLGSDSMVMNVLRMCVCGVIGLLLISLQGDLPALGVGGRVLFVSFLSGFFSAAFVVSWLLAVRSGAYMMVEVFLLLGSIVPIALCAVLFSEPIGLRQIAGIVLLLISTYIMCTYNATVKGKMGFKSLLLLIFCGFSCGAADFSQKLFVMTCAESSVTVFNFYTYVFAAVVLLVACVIFRGADQKRGNSPRAPFAIIRPIWIYVLVMAACLFANSFFKTQAALYLDAVQLYPLSQGCSVVLGLVMAAVCFKERINAKCIVGMSLAFAALLLINL